MERSARSVLINSSIALVEDWATQEAPLTRSAEDYSPKTQICFPYRGAFIWHVGGQDIVGDANQILFVPPGEAFRLSQLHRDGCGELIVTPRPDVVAELVGNVERPCVHPLFPPPAAPRGPHDPASECALSPNGPRRRVG